jgi:hypothetical protein
MQMARFFRGRDVVVVRPDAASHVAHDVGVYVWSGFPSCDTKHHGGWQGGLLTGPRDNLDGRVER